MGHGPPPTGRLLERGVRPVAHRRRRLERAGRDVHADAHGARLRRGSVRITDTPDEAFAPTLTHRDVLEFATIDGARACGLDDKVGSLTPRKQADIVLLERQRDQHRADGRSDRDDRRVLRHVERRLGVRRRARRQARRDSSSTSISIGSSEARRVEEPHPRRGRAAARVGGRVGGSGVDRTSLEPGPRRAGRALRSSARKERANGKRQRRRRRRHAGNGPRARAVVRRRGPRGDRDRQGSVPRGGCREGDRRQHARYRVRSRRAAHDRRPARGRRRRRSPRARRDRARHQQGAGVRHRRRAAGSSR